MSRGDQRERDRAKTQAKLQARQKPVKEGTPMQRNQADADRLAQKVAAKQAKMKEMEGVEQSTASGPPKPKKKSSIDASLDDLLSAGLTKAKKK